MQNLQKQLDLACDNTNTIENYTTSSTSNLLAPKLHQRNIQQKYFGFEMANPCYWQVDFPVLSICSTQTTAKVQQCSNPATDVACSSGGFVAGAPVRSVLLCASRPIGARLDFWLAVEWLPELFIFNSDCGTVGGYSYTPSPGTPRPLLCAPAPTRGTECCCRGGREAGAAVGACLRITCSLDMGAGSV